MGEVLTFTAEARRDHAWIEYREHAAKAVNEPRLLLDRDFFDKYVRLEDRYKRMLLATDRR